MAARMDNYIATKLADPLLVLNSIAEKTKFCISLLSPKGTSKSSGRTDKALELWENFKKGEF
jgi:hypothetical protein